MNESNLKLKFQKTLDEMFEGEGTAKLRAVKERGDERRTKQSPFLGSNKRSKERRTLNNPSRGLTDAQIIKEYKNEVKRLRQRIDDNAVTQGDYVVYYSCITLALITLITWAINIS